MNNRWALPTLLVIALVIAGALVYQSQQLASTQSTLDAAQADIAQLRSTATQQSGERIAQSTAAAATEVALLDSAGATQSALQSSAATAQAHAEATQAAQADAQATLSAELDAAQVTATAQAATVAEQSSEATQVAEQMATLEALATFSAAFVPVATATPAVSIQQPVAPVTVESLLYQELFDQNRGDYWYEGNREELARLDIEDGVYRFTYIEATSNDVRWLMSNSIRPTEANSLLEFEFRVIGCTSRHEFTNLGIFFDATQISTYAFVLFCNDVAWSLVQLGEVNENVDFGLFNIEDRLFSDWHTFSAWFLDDEVIFFLDGIELTREPLARTGDGTTYLRVSSDDPVTVEFDNLRVWQTAP
jgi:hypothetical protein